MGTVCIKAQGVLASYESGDVGPSSTSENRNNRASERLLHGFWPSRGTRSGSPIAYATVPLVHVLGRVRPVIAGLARLAAPSAAQVRGDDPERRQRCHQRPHMCALWGLPCSNATGSPAPACR